VPGRATIGTVRAEVVEIVKVVKPKSVGLGRLPRVRRNLALDVKEPPPVQPHQALVFRGWSFPRSAHPATWWRRSKIRPRLVEPERRPSDDLLPLEVTQSTPPNADSGHALLASLRGFDGHPTDFENLGQRNGRGGAANRIDEGLHASAHPFVLTPRAHPAEPWPPKAAKHAKVVELQHTPRDEHLDSLFRKRFAAVGEVVDRADGTVREIQRHRRAISSRGVHQPSAVTHDRVSYKVPQEVDEVAVLTDESPATDCVVLGPMRRRDGTGVYSHDARLWRRRTG